MKTLAFFHMKGGVGKTTAAVNFAYLAAQDDKRTLLWDLDAQGLATYHFQILSPAKISAWQLHKQTKRVNRLIKATDYPHLDLIPASFKIRHLDVALGDLKRGTRLLSKFVKKLSPQYEYLFCDCPASLSLLAQSVFQASDYLIIPVVPTTLSLETFRQVQQYLSKHFSKKPQLIPFFSMVDQRKSLHQKIMAQHRDDGVFCRSFIPTRSIIEQMGTKRAPLPSFSPRSTATGEFQILWDEIQSRCL